MEAKTQFAIMHVHIAKVDQVLYSDKAQSVTLPALEGEVTILPNHIPLVTPLKAGRIVVRESGSEKLFDIEKGLLEVSKEGVVVLL